jgi:hypothetical protein
MAFSFRLPNNLILVTRHRSNVSGSIGTIVGGLRQPAVERMPRIAQSDSGRAASPAQQRRRPFEFLLACHGVVIPQR